MSKRILIIDDDQTILALLKDLLQDAAYNVETTGPAHAIDMALNHPPDLILLDMMMPVVSGIEISQTLRADSRTSYVPIVAISAAATIEEMARRADVDAVLKKPFDFQKVLSTIEQLIGEV